MSIVVRLSVGLFIGYMEVTLVIRSTGQCVILVWVKPVLSDNKAGCGLSVKMMLSMWLQGRIWAHFSQVGSPRFPARNSKWYKIGQMKNTENRAVVKTWVQEVLQLPCRHRCLQRCTGLLLKRKMQLKENWSRVTSWIVRELQLKENWRKVTSWIARELQLKGNQSEDTSWPEELEHLQIFPSVGVILFFYRYVLSEVVVIPSLLSFSGCSPWWFALSPIKGQERLACDMFDTFATYSSLIRDIRTDAYCWAQRSSTHNHVFLAFKHWFLTNRTGNQLKNWCLIFSFHCYQ